MNFQEQQKKGLLTDITLTLKDTCIKAHKSVLLSESIYFMKAIMKPDSSILELNPDVESIDLTGAAFSDAVLVELIDLMYQSYTFGFNVKNYLKNLTANGTCVQSLIDAADHFSMIRVASMLCNGMKSFSSTLSTEPACKALSLFILKNWDRTELPVIMTKNMLGAAIKNIWEHLPALFLVKFARGMRETCGSSGALLCFQERDMNQLLWSKYKSLDDDVAEKSVISEYIVENVDKFDFEVEEISELLSENDSQAVIKNLLKCIKSGRKEIEGMMALNSSIAFAAFQVRKSLQFSFTFSEAQSRVLLATDDIQAVLMLTPKGLDTYTINFNQLGNCMEPKKVTAAIRLKLANKSELVKEIKEVFPKRYDPVVSPSFSVICTLNPGATYELHLYSITTAFVKQ